MKVFRRVLPIVVLVFIIPTTRVFALADSCNAYPDLYYEYQLAKIDNETAVSFDFTPQVKRYLEIYIDTRKEQISNMVDLSRFYFPIFESIFEKYGLPKELKYLAAVESALDSRAVSKSEAVGLWQFKINSGQIYGLDVTQYVDDRMDPIKSTEAACQYLSELHKIFNDWHLTLAAYNIGPTALQKIIKKNKGETNFWKLYPKLPEAAQNYVPAFIAVTYVMQNYNAHDISVTHDVMEFSHTDTVKLKSAVDLAVLSEKSGISIETLQFLNPQYLLQYIPQENYVRVPNDKKQEVENSLSNVYADTNEPETHILPDVAKRWIDYTVVSGDSMIKIANRYGCTVNDIRLWNLGIDTVLSVGTKIKILVPEL